MLKRMIVFFLMSVGFVCAAKYTCSCYCPNSSTYVGAAYANICSSSACATACYNSLSKCTSRLNSHGTCMGGNRQTSTFTSPVSTNGIVGIVVGSLLGVGLLITVIVIVVIVCKRKKRAQVWGLQPQQQWAPGVQPYPPAVPMYYSQSQYPPPYAVAQPIPIQT